MISRLLMLCLSSKLYNMNTKYLGVDFGSKRVGLAVSDETGKLAFPLSVISNDKNLIENVASIIKEKNINTVVLGESKNYAGENNAIMGDIEKFKRNLEEKTKLKIIFEPEFLSSAQAERLQGKNKMHDASAAAIILQSYLDRNAKE